MYEQTLRIGICGCGKRYIGKFENKRIWIWNQWVRLEEVILLNETDGSLRQKRCHFFLDHHIDPDQALHLVFIERTPVPIGSWNSKNQLVEFGDREHLAPKPVTVRTIRRWIKYLAELIPKQHRKLFLDLTIIRYESQNTT